MRESYQHTPTGGGALATEEGQKHWKTQRKFRFFNEGKLSTYPHRRRGSCHWGTGGEALAIGEGKKALENPKKM